MSVFTSSVATVFQQDFATTAQRVAALPLAAQSIGDVAATEAARQLG
jgi:hypothetical protein